MAGVLHLTVQDRNHLLSDGGVLHGGSLEDGAGPPVTPQDEEVEILTGAEEAGVVVVRVQDHKAGGANQVWDHEIRN